MMVDYLIVGQGIAGSVLATKLVEAGKKVAIMDRRHFPTASSVAAGLINPFTGPKMVKSWMFDELIEAAIYHYREAERVLDTSFFEERSIFRPFNSIADQNDWFGRSTAEGYKSYILRLFDIGQPNKQIHNPFGGLESPAWVLHVPKFLVATYQNLRGQAVYLEEEFDETILQMGNDFVKYRDVDARKVIFCTGYQARNSQFFHWLPLVPVKGELLDIKFSASFKTIYNHSCFIIPRGDGTAIAGSTYNRDDLTMTPTHGAKMQIEDNLRQMTDIPFEILGQSAGIRPGTLTRRPLIGRHPIHSSVYIFNGLGTKGVSLAPYFANQFVKYLERGDNLHESVDIEKYYSLYFNSQSSKQDK